MRVGWVYDPFFLRHDTGRSNPERPERLEAIVAALDEAGLLVRMIPLHAEPAPVAAIESVHDPVYVHLVQMACEQGMGFIGDNNTTLCSESYEVARLAAGGVLAACDAMLCGRVSAAFCAVRPSGHHAECDRAGGFCLFNHVAIAAQHLRQSGLDRVAIVDWDAHHGNGTQRIFEARNDVLYVSLHESPATCWPHSGHADERGIGAGEGFTLNVPLRAGSGDREYRTAFEQQVLPALEAFAPACLLISAGFDACAADDIANLSLEPASYGWMTRSLLALADRHCGGRVISVLEGGYDLPSLRRAVVEHVQALVE